LQKIHDHETNLTFYVSLTRLPWGRVVNSVVMKSKYPREHVMTN